MSKVGGVAGDAGEGREVVVEAIAVIVEERNDAGRSMRMKYKETPERVKILTRYV